MSALQPETAATASPGFDTPVLDARSLELRRLIARGMMGGGRGHPGAALSLVEILRVLYDSVMHYDPANPLDAARDRFILSKGHGCLALYALLVDKGFVDASLLDNACMAGGRFGGHPEHSKIPGVEASTGALGHGFPIAVGKALALRLQRNPARVFVVMGDGEINEGSVWEAAMCAAKHGLCNLVAIIDYNKMQSYGPTETVMPLEPLADKWRSFGFATDEVDGHDVAALEAKLKGIAETPRQPTALICHTIKGKGIPEAEQNARWHHLSRVSPDDLAIIKRALDMPS